MKTKVSGIILCLLILIGNLVFADTISLTNGKSYTGKFIKGDTNTIVFQTDGKTMYFLVSSVSSVSFEEKKQKAIEAEVKGKGLLKGVVTYYFNRSVEYKLNGTEDD